MKKYILVINTCICLTALLFAGIKEACGQSSDEKTNNVGASPINKSARADSLFVQLFLPVKNETYSPPITKLFTLAMFDSKSMNKSSFFFYPHFFSPL